MSVSTLNSVVGVISDTLKLMDNASMLTGEASHKILKQFKAILKQMPDEEHEAVILAVMTLIAKESKGCYVDMQDLLSSSYKKTLVLEAPKVEVVRVEGKPPATKQWNNRFRDSNHGIPSYVHGKELFICMGGVIKGTGAQQGKYVPICGFPAYPHLGDNIKMNLEGWVDELPEEFIEDYKSNGNELYFPLDGTAKTSFKGKRATIDGLEMGCVKVRAGKRSKAKL